MKMTIKQKLKSKSLKSKRQQSIQKKTTMYGGIRHDEGSKDDKLTKGSEYGYDGDTDESGKPHGQGTMRWQDGTVYSGDWEHDMMHGKGKMNFAEKGVVYKGDWKDDKPHGQGTYIWTELGEVYKGSMEKGELHGEGILTTKDGKYIDYKKGQFKNNKFCDGVVVRRYENKSIMETYKDCDVINTKTIRKEPDFSYDSIYWE
jgi:hypothetical protein